MVAEDGPPVDLLPEERVAQLVFVRHRLSIPVDIGVLAQCLADTELIDFPFDVDGLCLPFAQPRPRLLINKSQAETRRRFTLAHELGHLLIPWHVGALGCHSDEPSGNSDDHVYALAEYEANRFASELLAPLAWVQRMMRPRTDVSDAIVSIAGDAGISRLAAAVAINRALPKGHVLVYVSATGSVQFALKSRGTAVPLPPKGQAIPDELVRLASSVLSVSVPGGCSICCIAIETPSVGRKPKRPANDILNAILNEHEMKQYSARINGIIGSGNSRELQSADEIYGVLLQRFVGRVDLTSVTDDPRFDTFLRAKSHELAQRRK